MSNLTCKECGQKIKLKAAKTMGERVRLLRLQRSLGLRELAREIRIAPTTITRIEQGFTNVHFEKILVICKFFGVSLNFLVHGKEKEDEGS